MGIQNSYIPAQELVVPEALWNLSDAEMADLLKQYPFEPSQLDSVVETDLAAGPAPVIDGMTHEEQDFFVDTPQGQQDAALFLTAGQDDPQDGDWSKFVDLDGPSTSMLSTTQSNDTIDPALSGAPKSADAPKDTNGEATGLTELWGELFGDF